jgi:uncharacterized protein YndB with AHSA1/START domain
METIDKTIITVESTVNAPVDKVWEYWSAPKHIMKWNQANDDWHCPKAENDLRTGGKFSTRMEAKDGSFGFDFGGEYDEVIPQKYISYTMGDGRTVKVKFEEKENATHITESFVAETQNSIELQKNGWQAIMDCFKRYVESH